MSLSLLGQVGGGYELSVSTTAPHQALITDTVQSIVPRATTRASSSTANLYDDDAKANAKKQKPTMLYLDIPHPKASLDEPDVKHVARKHADDMDMDSSRPSAQLARLVQWLEQQVWTRFIKSCVSMLK